MTALPTLSGLSAFSGRGAGTDSERRAAKWLAGELALGRGRTRIETFWCRPNWALAHSWHVLLGLAGSLVSVGSPRVGGALILVALLSLIADATTGHSLGRRLTPERASQNVIFTPGPAQKGSPVRLILTSYLDAGRVGLMFRAPPRNAAARLRELTHGLFPGWLGWLAIALICLEGIAVARLDGSTGTAIGLAQLVPTVMLVLALALLLEHGTADFGPGAGDNASGVAAAVGITRALSAGLPGHATVELVLQGAGEGSAIGLRRYLRARKRDLTPSSAVVLGISPCTSGAPRWWVSDGQLVPRRYFGALRGLAATVASEAPHLGAQPVRSRGGSPALPAAGRLPALAVGMLDPHGLVPGSHTRADTVDHVDPASIDRAVEFGLLLVDAVDAHLGRRRAPTPG
ncbi:MAG: M28 family peptidase [Solirubrobacteraceae bacterium]